ncbi:hypothetical protein H0H81_004444 [Sphagnurus paluster]|uniref:Uncharacterized protein n=1 Tax=Sphagnurus paluster TaxID=117069 RepID=A0A9P7FWB1_9AGAR|nr:hypothetical protein H0H81_004444 [Sphagnurus paluster]
MYYERCTQDTGDSHSGSGSLPSLPIIITTASAVFLAVDATISTFRKYQAKNEPAIIVTQPIEPPPPSPGSLTHFVDKTRSILADVQAIEEQLASEKARRLQLSALVQNPPRPRPAPIDTRNLPPRSRAKPVKPKSSCPTLSQTRSELKPKNKNKPRPVPVPEAKQESGPSTAFSAFCERLLLTNRVWQQERELKAAREARAAYAFSNFCEQLLLWNRVWALERAGNALAEEKARVERARAAAVTRAASRMVCEVQRERMVEEFVKELIAEAKEARQELEELKSGHEREVREMHGEWVKDYREVVREVERLKLAQRARLAEQAVSNAAEDSLFESLRERAMRVEELEKKLKEFEEEDVTLNGADMFFNTGEKDDEATDVELDTLSELSSSSTCVSSGGSVRRAAKGSIEGIPRRRCVSQGGFTPSRGSLHSRSSSVSSTSNAGLALKPLLIDQGKSVSAMSAQIGVATRTCNHSGRPLAPRTRTVSVAAVKSHTTPVPGTGNSTGATKRAPWRI